MIASRVITVDGGSEGVAAVAKDVRGGKGCGDKPRDTNSSFANV